MKGSIYSYFDYKKYIHNQLKLRTDRGPRARLAESIGCQLPYLSQVLNGSADLSIEQAAAANYFFGHSKRESSYFIHLVSYARAGTQELKSFYRNLLTEIASEENQIAQRLELKNELTDEEKSIYYSSWEYAAVHMAASLPTLSSKESIADFLDLPVSRIHDITEFLLRIGLLARASTRFKIGPQRLHVSTSSPYLKQHLTNWRIRAIQSLDYGKTDELHYSSIVSMSEADVTELREIMLNAISKIRAKVKDSPEETVISYSFDLFRVQKK